MTERELLELCIRVTGSFENGGGASYTTVAGSEDGQGLSCGVLQWNAGQGTLQTLVQTIGNAMGWDKAQTFFHSDIHHFAVLRPTEAVAWCIDHYIQEGTTHVDPAAKQCWQDFLGQPESVAAQISMASNGVLSRAKVLATKFCPDYPDNNRVLVFFFDLVTQSGGMQNQRGHVDPVPSGQTPDISDALAFAQQKDPRCLAIWTTPATDDPLAQLLLYYAYHRSLLSNPLYVWDAFSRRGSIGCRGGRVHAATVDFTSLLD